jgi:outer membrane protein W
MRSGRGAVCAAGLEVLKERDHAVRIDVRQIQVHHVSVLACREKPEQ